MKKLMKRLICMGVACAVLLTSFSFTPTVVQAAMGKVVTKGMSVTDTGITGFENIEGTFTFGKQIIVYGTNKSGKAVYTYSTNGKTFEETQTLGLEVSGQEDRLKFVTSGKRLYVFLRDKYGSLIAYKSVTSAKNLTSAKKVSLKKVKWPKGFEEGATFEISLNTMADNKNSTIVLRLTFSKEIPWEDPEMEWYPPDHEIIGQTLVLDGTKVKQVEESLEHSYYQNPDSSDLQLVKIDYDENDEQQLFYTEDGINYTKMKSPNYKYADSMSNQITYKWVNNQFMAIRNFGALSGGGTTHTLAKAKDGSSYYYVYNFEKNKWVLQKINVKNDTAFRIRGKNYATYYDVDADKKYPVLYYKVSSGNRIIYTTDGTTWTSLPHLVDKELENKKYKLNETSYVKSGNKTYAVAYYYYPYGSYGSFKYVVYTLKNNKWKELYRQTFSFRYNHHYNFDFDFSANVPTMIYYGKYSSEKCSSYNLLTGKGYQLPFFEEQVSNSIYGTTIKGVKVFCSGKYIYTTNDAGKNIRKLVIKENGTKVDKTITQVCEVRAGTKFYTYIIAKDKMYYKPSSTFVKVTS